MKLIQGKCCILLVDFPSELHLYSNYTDILSHLHFFHRIEMLAFFFWQRDELLSLCYPSYKLRQMLTNCGNSSCTMLIQLSEVNRTARRHKTCGAH